MSKEVEQALQKKVKEYEDLIEELLQKPASIGKVVSEPFLDKGIQNYRVLIEGSVRICTYTRPLKFSFEGKNLPMGTEVLCHNDVIIGVVPELLQQRQ